MLKQLTLNYSEEMWDTGREAGLARSNGSSLSGEAMYRHKYWLGHVVWKPVEVLRFVLLSW